jgi:hypothetical protein
MKDLNLAKEFIKISIQIYSEKIMKKDPHLLFAFIFDKTKKLDS